MMLPADRRFAESLSRLAPNFPANPPPPLQLISEIGPKPARPALILAVAIGARFVLSLLLLGLSMGAAAAWEQPPPPAPLVIAIAAAGYLFGAWGRWR